MPQALPLTDRISQSSRRTRKFRVFRAQFGDGYAQTAPDGINYKVDTWEVVYENLSSSERTTLWSAIDTVGAVDYFTWTPPGGSSTKWKIVGEVQETPVSGDIYTVSFNLEQVFL